MFIRVKKAPTSNNKVVLLVESYRDKGKPKQRLIKHIGTAKNAKEVEQLKEAALALKTYMTQLKLAKKTNDIKPAGFGTKLGKMGKIKKGTRLDPLQLKEVNRCILGIHDVYGYIYDLLGFTNPFYWPKRREYSAKVLREIVLSRIARPCSKRSTVKMLATEFGTKLNLDHVYQMMDKIDDRFCSRIQERALAATLRLTAGKLKVLFYDATTLYFESFTADDLKQNGYSKDMKFNQPQVLLALFVTQDGLPVGYEVFPGATYEGHTLIPVLERLKSEYQIDDVVFVADRGMLNKENLKYLEDNKFTYIVGARLKNLGKARRNEVLSWGDDIKAKGLEHAVCSLQISTKKRLVLSYDKNRARKDEADREDAILKLQKKLEKTKNPKNLISNYGYQKYIKLDVNGAMRVSVDREKYEHAARWDGLVGVFTNQNRLNDSETLEHYSSLWQIEESFRIQKHDLRIRPIYHWTPRRVKAHIAISFMAFTCVRHLEYLVKSQYKKLSPEAIRQTLLKVQATVIGDKKTGRKYLLPSRIESEAKHIYGLVGAKIQGQMQVIL